MEEQWAQVASQRLQEAIREAEIKRGDREANVLLNLPKNTEAMTEWIKEMRLGETNSDSLIAACRFGLAHARTLRSVVGGVAAELSRIESEQAQSCAALLR
jgi:hypothetical protein